MLRLTLSAVELLRRRLRTKWTTNPRRMRVALYSLCLSALLLLPPLLAACTPVEHPLDRRLRLLVLQPDAPLASLAVVVVAEGAVRYEGYWGQRRIDAADPTRSLPVTPATKFRVASVSKLVTSLGAMRLVEEGKLQLDRDVSVYLGFRLRNPHYPDQPITARMLLSHTSSLRDGGLYSVPLPYTLADLLDPKGAFYAGGAHFAQPQRGSDHRPGAYFTYANLNFGVLATVMEAVAGQRFDHYMRRHILAPLDIDGGYMLDDLSRSGYEQLATLYTKQDANGVWDAGGPWHAQFDAYDEARGRSQGGEQHRPVVWQAAGGSLAGYRPGTNATIFSPYAGLRISARDLAKVMQLFFDGGRYAGKQILSPASIRRLLREQWRFEAERSNGDTNGGLLRAWGLGLQHTTATQDAAGGDRMAPRSAATFWGHRGDAYGLLAGVWFDPQREAGFIYIIGGVGDDPLHHLGSYSSFYRWEEEIQPALVAEINRWEAGR